MLLSKGSGTKRVFLVALQAFEALCKARVAKIQEQSRLVKDIFAMLDGVDQRNRDLSISSGQHSESLIALAKPEFQAWLWKYDPGDGVGRSLMMGDLEQW